MAKRLKKGIFITFEGVEGCGKSTHSRKICKLLKEKGYSVTYIREPGGTEIGEKIRKILLDTKNKKMSERAELFLFEANRAQIVREVIGPALLKGKIVICDRFSDSTTAYQGYAGGEDIAFIEKVNAFASDGIEPDLTIILDIQTKVGLKRAVAGGKKDRMEQKDISYHKRVREGYKKLARRHKKRIVLIGTRPSTQETQQLIRKEVLAILTR